MEIKFCVSCIHHFSGGDPKSIDYQRFDDYDSAFKRGKEIEEECIPAVCCIVDEKYIFNCERSEVDNIPYKIYKIHSSEEGFVEIAVWWKYFINNPKKYSRLACYVLK